MVIGSGRRRLEAEGHCEQPHLHRRPWHLRRYCFPHGEHRAHVARIATQPRPALAPSRQSGTLPDCLNAFQMPQPAGRFMPRPCSSTRHCPFMPSPHLIAIYVHMYMCCPMQSAVLRALSGGRKTPILHDLTAILLTDRSHRLRSACHSISGFELEHLECNIGG